MGPFSVLCFTDQYLDMSRARCNSAVPLMALDKHVCQIRDYYMFLTWFDNHNDMFWNMDHKHPKGSSPLHLL